LISLFEINVVCIGFCGLPIGLLKGGGIVSSFKYAIVSPLKGPRLLVLQLIASLLCPLYKT
jgi:hypothetical protein